MLIAIVNGQTVEKVGDYRDLFPNTSFPSTGISEDFLVENNAKKVNVFKSYDVNTEKLIPASPYVDGEWVYTVDITPLSLEEIESKESQAKAVNKAQAEQKLAATDWTQVSDVPLLNKQEFTDYRAAVRAIALNPPVEATFPKLPVEQWSE